MKGSVESYQTAAGRRWKIRYEKPPGPDGKRRQGAKGGFIRERDARRYLRGLLCSLDEGMYMEPAPLTLAQYIRDEWLPTRRPRDHAVRGHRGAVSLATWESYRSDLEAHVLPRIGSVRLQALTPKHLSDMYDALESIGGRARAGLSAKTVVNVHGVLHKALGDAVRRRLLARNPADAVDAPRAERQKTAVWSVNQLRAFLRHVESDRFYPAWLLFSTTGMRRGELAGLAWNDLDLEAGVVRIDWTLGVVDNRATWKPRPKTEAGERSMALDPATLDALRLHRKWQAEERLLMGPAWHAHAIDQRGTVRGCDGIVFTWPDGRIVHPERWTQWFLRHCEGAGLPRIRLHDVRHTYATAALVNAEGWHDVKIISQRLGHASVGITLDTYSHVLPAADEDSTHPGERDPRTVTQGTEAPCPPTRHRPRYRPRQCMRAAVGGAVMCFRSGPVKLESAKLPMAESRATNAERG